MLVKLIAFACIVTSLILMLIALCCAVLLCMNVLAENYDIALVNVLQVFASGGASLVLADTAKDILK